MIEDIGYVSSLTAHSIVRNAWYVFRSLSAELRQRLSYPPSGCILHGVAKKIVTNALYFSRSARIKIGDATSNCSVMRFFFCSRSDKEIEPTSHVIQWGWSLEKVTVSSFHFVPFLKSKISLTSCDNTANIVFNNPVHVALLWVKFLSLIMYSTGSAISVSVVRSSWLMLVRTVVWH